MENDPTAETLPFLDASPRRTQKIGVRVPKADGVRVGNTMYPLPKTPADPAGSGMPPLNLETTVMDAAGVPFVEPGPNPVIVVDGQVPTETSPVSEQGSPQTSIGSNESGPSSPPEPSPRDLTWGQYTKWRESKCPPPWTRLPLSSEVDELDHAIHEAVGEWAELIDSLKAIGFNLFTEPEAKAEVVGELGDCLFTINWLLNALGVGMGVSEQKIADCFVDTQKLHHFHGRRSKLSGIKSAILKHPVISNEGERAAMGNWLHDIDSLLLNGAAGLGKVSDFFKKIRWHQRQLTEGDSINSVVQALYALECICVLCGTTTIDAALGNIEKLNKRYPNGYETGGGKR